MRRVALLIALTSLIALTAVPARACGTDTDCRIGERTYRIYKPEGQTGPMGALVYAHGYKGSARGAMGNTSLRALADELGVALVATKSASDDWLIPGVPENPAEDGAKEFLYYDAVIDDLARRHGIDRARLIATGFSAGGMMVWNLACHRGASFAAFVPIAGTFWDPVPETCPSAPVSLVHVHGTSDRIVPLGGRAIQQTRQGDVPTALERARVAGGFGPAELMEADGLTCQWRTNTQGDLLAFCTHPGGHSMKAAYLRTAWAMLQDAGVLD